MKIPPPLFRSALCNFRAAVTHPVASSFVHAGLQSFVPVGGRGVFSGN